MRNRMVLIFLFAAVLIVAGIVARYPAMAQQKSQEISFHTYELWVDSKYAPLAAYQVEIAYGRNVEILSLEGGEVTSYRRAPYFDRKGLRGGRIIVAAYTTKDDLAPVGNTRVARIHTVLQGSNQPTWQVKLMAAAKPGGERICVDVKLKKVN